MVRAEPPPTVPVFHALFRRGSCLGEDGPHVGEAKLRDGLRFPSTNHSLPVQLVPFPALDSHIPPLQCFPLVLLPENKRKQTPSNEKCTRSLHQFHLRPLLLLWPCQFKGKTVLYVQGMREIQSVGVWSMVCIYEARPGPHFSVWLV